MRVSRSLGQQLISITPGIGVNNDASESDYQTSDDPLIDHLSH